ncbi:MAG: alpha/beta hydrolase [Anaerolineales bacterium]
MKSALKVLTYLSAIGATLPFIRPKDNAVRTLIWFPKMISAALAPVLGLTAALGALLGLVKRDGKLTSAGLLGAGLAARFVAEIPDAREQFTREFDANWKEPSPTQTITPVDFQPDLIIAEKPWSGKPFYADLWQPPAGALHSGLGIIYSHGGGWRVGDKDMLTGHFFSRLAKDGHVVLDIAYSLYPEADIPTMVKEINLAILWMKENCQHYQINPERIVLMGGSAGAHLSLLAGYAPGQPEFHPTENKQDTTVRGVVAYYPVVDLRSLSLQRNRQAPTSPNVLDKAADAMLNFIFDLHPEAPDQDKNGGKELDRSLIQMLGGTQDELPEIYDLLSPIKHVNKKCPATLLLQGSDDVFDLERPVQRLYLALQEAGVPSIFVEYPHAEHGFDLIFPQISPLAKAATREVERFLAMMA